ncbi:hypothetical protein [Marinomonas mediterranea]|jgi:hypothetical protein|uniref:Uncharacterized protein n=1 Tax=Marinomonas mediterranea (strain ATCC 700492 / JCM 21426 / NBRC 103028 / MMB-1) TaxID=717774 RepID=F2K0C6_MARM1|nr:hypothetical protein [Marinomonas mediterranea]ADZ89841.1 hypothetical protein Marme_0545 [Marinomonas mediterranea MMB-1]WCN07929.1 hypothetical protein GV055_02775 [Marinomonas mediterranea]WCN12024.1 hypothetical protein GV054_02785 [Marinomonas mediterranea]WCN16061.1 hypothetical protein GV053_02715 [Marinomonas mediterranea MMB-1]
MTINSSEGLNLYQQSLYNLNKATTNRDAADRYPPEKDEVTLTSASQELLQRSKEGTENTASELQEEQDFVQVSSSIGRFSRVTGLSNEEAVDLYRSIQSLG